MSLKSLLMPIVSRRLLSAERLQAQRDRAERRRRARGEPHRVHYFHQACDPYSALAAQALPGLARRYDIRIEPHLVPPPADDAAPERERLVAYSRRDAALLAGHHGLAFADPDRQPTPEALAHHQALLLAALRGGRFEELAGPLAAALWSGGPDPATGLQPCTAAEVEVALSQGRAQRQALGHYLGGMFFYAGEWYWGLDRLHHLEARLQTLGAQRPGVSGALFAPDAEPATSAAPTAGAAPELHFYLSLRSPYTAIAVPRVFALAQHAGARVRLRYLLPMVMRGLPVPRAKRRYIAADAAREARLHGVPFGCINDPVGRPTERGLALLALAERQGGGEAFLRSFMQGVWAEGVDAGSARGLRRLAERAGLDWADCGPALDDASWRSTAEANRREMFALGLWGVPSFRVGDFSTWGQDRLWAVHAALRAPRTGPDPA